MTDLDRVAAHATRALDALRARVDLLVMRAGAAPDARTRDRLLARALTCAVIATRAVEIDDDRDRKQDREQDRECPGVTLDPRGATCHCARPVGHAGPHRRELVIWADAAASVQP